MKLKPILFLFLTSLIIAIACQSSDQTSVSFNKDIRPILNENCLACHGGVKAMGEFSLLFEEDAFAKTKSGKTAIVPGSHKKSELYRRLIHSDPELRMPFEKEPLTPKEINLIAQWIDEGAKWEKHWAYIPPQKNIPTPQVNNSQWVKNDLDYFILKELEKKDLTPNESADAHTLLRRLSFDLIGLPPTQLEAKPITQNFSDKDYEALVNRLLSSPHFGERWASMWLDLARYADTKGYEKDSNRNIWKYRDWVINAFNTDMPFDQFTIEQLAGDLLPNPNESQLIATAYHRNAISNDEGGTDDEEFRIASTIERISNTYEVWMGTTFACVQCHSHPYDPFRHEEFYESLAFFNNTMDKDIYNEQPKLYTYAPEDAKQVKAIIKWINHKIDKTDQEIEDEFLFQQKDALLDELDYRVVEAEEYHKSSDLIELIWPELDMVWQVQDSSWIMFESVDLTKVEKIGFRVASPLDWAGNISIHINEVNGPKIGEVKVTKTADWNGWQWSKPTEDNLFKIYSTFVKSQSGTHDIYFKFSKGDTFIQHLFYVDKIVYQIEGAKKDQYGKEMQNKLAQLVSIPANTTPILQELPEDKARPTHFLERGSWLTPKQEVNAAIPQIFKETINVSPKDRLDFAKALTHPKNPLTARVIVNRVWEQLFGFGLVESMEEFGSQGFTPTHPELLDWLAVEFMEQHQWSIKSLIKQLVTSATYRQASDASDKKLEIDPRNQYLSRGTRTRLSAEQIRDQVLAVSGLLDKTIGGPSVIMESLNIGQNRRPRWAITGDKAKYRRTLYTFWKRTDPFPSMITFDSPDRTICASQRIRTNTPLQALNLLNNETYFEAAVHIAKKVFSEHQTLNQQLEAAYFQIMLQPASPKKLTLLQELYSDALDHFQQEKEAVQNMLKEEKASTEEKEKIAALSITVNTLLNLDEFIVKK